LFSNARAEEETRLRVVIAESQFVGHYFTYVRRVLEAVREIATDITLLVSPEGLRSAEFETNIRPILKSENVIDSLRRPRGSVLKGTWDMVRLVRDAVRTTKADHLFMTTADNIAQAVGMASLGCYRPFPRSVQSEGLLTKLSFTYANADRKIPYPLIKAGLEHSPWTRLHVIDLLAYQWLKNNAPRLAARFSLIPDPVETFTQLSKQEARLQLSLPEDGRYLVCPGILNYRKGIGALIEAFLSSKTSYTDRILLAGPIEPEIQLLLADPRCVDLIRQQRLIVVGKYLSAEELGQVICAGDITVCPYPQQCHPSSIAIKSLACNRPVLGANSFWLGTMIPAFSMGWNAPVNDTLRFGGMIGRALNESAGWERLGIAKRLVDFQSISRFKDCWVEGLRVRNGFASSDLHSEGESIIADAGLSDYK